MMKRICRRWERRTVLSGWRWLLAICCAVLPAMPPISIEAQTERQSTQSNASGSELSTQEKKVIELPARRLGQRPQRHERRSGDGGRGTGPIR